MIQAINTIHKTIVPSLTFIPELSCLRRENLTYFEHEFEEVMRYNDFKSNDLVGNEQIPVDNFKPIYRKAKKANRILIVHIGEFFDADSILRVVETLVLNKVQQRVKAVESK